VTQSEILFLVSIERGTSPRVYHHCPWLSDMSQLGVLPVGSLRALAVARVGVSDRCSLKSDGNNRGRFHRCPSRAIKTSQKLTTAGCSGVRSVPFRKLAALVNSKSTFRETLRTRVAGISALGGPKVRQIPRETDPVTKGRFVVDGERVQDC
jgi:hypothetical protein